MMEQLENIANALDRRLKNKIFLERYLENKIQ
jgi:hypothetical protein